jgi:hypothetical protein
MAPFLEFKVGVKREKYLFSRFHAKSRKSFSLFCEIASENIRMLVFPDNFRMSICFPESFSENILKTGANARGRMKKLAVFAQT